MAYLFISHDMAVVDTISDRVAVMYMGQIVEMGSRAQVFGNPQHAYTRRLIDAVPVPDPTHQRVQRLRVSDEIKSPIYASGNQPKRLNLRDIGSGHMLAE